MTIKLIQPLVGNPPITQMFGENPGFYAQWGYPGHNGVDYGVPEGASVLAAAGGVVDRVGFETGGYGKYVRVMHSPGVWTYYAHLSEIIVANNGRVTSGQVIARSGNTGASTGPHLHFGLRIGANGSYRGYVDPIPYMTVSAPPWQPPIITPPPDWQPPDVTPIPPPVAPPEAWPPFGTTKLPKPVLWRARPDYPARPVRKGPTTQAPILYTIPADKTFVTDTLAPGDGGIWGKTQDGGWVGIVHNGEELFFAEAV